MRDTRFIATHFFQQVVFDLFGHRRGSQRIKKRQDLRTVQVSATQASDEFIVNFTSRFPVSQRLEKIAARKGFGLRRVLRFNQRSNHSSPLLLMIVFIRRQARPGSLLAAFNRRISLVQEWRAEGCDSF